MKEEKAWGRWDERESQKSPPAKGRGKESKTNVEELTERLGGRKTREA